MIRLYLLVCMSLLLSSCGTVSKLLPNFAYNKDNQSNSSSDTLSQSIGYANVGLSAGDNKSKSYNRSNVRSEDLNSDKHNNLGTSVYQIGGTVKDMSDKMFYDQTRNHTKDNSYAGENINVHNYSLLPQVISLVENILYGVVYLIFFYIGWRSHIFTINRKNKIKKRNKNI